MAVAVVVAVAVAVAVEVAVVVAVVAEVVDKQQELKKQAAPILLYGISVDSKKKKRKKKGELRERGLIYITKEIQLQVLALEN